MNFDQAVQTAIVQTLAVFTPTPDARATLDANTVSRQSATPAQKMVATTQAPTPAQAETGLPTSAPPEQIIQIVTDADLLRMLPDIHDLPPEALYYLCDGCSNIKYNEEISWEYGKALADVYISQTGRLRGWSTAYVRGTWEVYAPETLTLEVQIFDSADGANRAVTEFNPYEMFPEQGWVLVESEVQLGSESVAAEKTYMDDGGSETVDHQLWFAYHNLVGIVRGEGWQEDIVPEMMADVARAMLNKMSLAPLSAPASPTLPP